MIKCFARIAGIIRGLRSPSNDIYPSCERRNFCRQQTSHNSTKVGSFQNKSMQYSDDILNSIATAMSELKSPSPPELSPDRGSLIEYALNIAFRPIRDDQWRVFGAVSIQRSIAARAAYRAATCALEEYVRGLPANHKINVYRDALDGFERCVHNARVAMNVVQHMEAKASQSKDPKKLIYSQNDGSPEDRLAKMDNRAKHFPEDVFAGDVLHPTPIWIRDEGLVCSTAELSFIELARLLEDLGDNIAFTAREALVNSRTTD